MEDITKYCKCQSYPNCNGCGRYLLETNPEELPPGTKLRKNIIIEELTDLIKHSNHSDKAKEWLIKQIKNKFRFDYNGY